MDLKIPEMFYQSMNSNFHSCELFKAAIRKVQLETRSLVPGKIVPPSTASSLPLSVC